MGSCISKITSPRSPIVEQSDGGLEEFQSRYIEDRLLGEGEFGKVKLCHDMKTNTFYAVKELGKGAQFKDNTLYSAVPADILLRECAILRALKGEHFTLKLLNVYETSTSILLVLDYYSGGEMMSWITNSTNDLNTETISRIAYQLLDALCHCHKHNIMHRDIKPENVMFVNKKSDSALRLVDFGGSLMVEKKKAQSDDNDDDCQEGFFGSGFYVSPEMFQRTYTAKTDVWSLGVTMYVLVAGFPADNMQKTFNVLQSNKSNRIKTLPNIPDELPDSFYALLEDMLVYRHTSRKSSKELLQSCDFIQYHKKIDINTTKNANNNLGKSLKNVVRRHTIYLDYVKFERGVTTILVTMMNEDEINHLLKKLEETLKDNDNTSSSSSVVVVQDSEQLKKGPSIQLDIVTIETLISVLQELRKVYIVDKVKNLPNSSLFQTYAYDTNLINQAMKVRKIIKDRGLSGTDSKSAHGGDIWKFAQSSVTNLQKRRTSSVF